MDITRQLHASPALPPVHQYRLLNTVHHLLSIATRSHRAFLLYLTEKQQECADICLCSLFVLYHSCVFPTLALPRSVCVLCVRAADGATSD